MNATLYGVELERGAGWLLARFTGEIDWTNAPAVERTLRDATHGGALIAGVDRIISMFTSIDDALAVR